MSSPETPQNPPPEGMPPSQPYPSAPQPGYPAPSQPYTPYGQPGYPAPSQPYPQPGYPSPSQPYPPQGQPGYPTPSQPYGQPATPYPSQPYPQQYAADGQPVPWPLGPDGQPLPPQVTPTTATAWGQLWPLWAWLAGGAVLAVLAILLFVSGSDWAAGARAAGGALIFGAVVLLATLGIRAAGGLFAATNSRRTSQIIGTSVAAVLLLAVAGVGIGAQAPIHLAQAHSLEGAKNYARALNEYQLGNAGAADLARTYNEWGEQLLASHQYNTAITKFETVINTYSSVSDQVTRAQAGEAKAYYGIGEAALSTGNYDDAVTAFTTLTTKFPSDPTTAKAHGDYATALFGLGKAQLASGGNTGCQGALTAYQLLTQSFSDTPEGQQAATALAAPQPVIGQFTGTVAPPSGEVALALLGTFAGGNFTIKYGAVISTSTGQFGFNPIPEGSYNLAAAFGTGSGTQYNITQLVGVVADNTGNNAYTIKTLPLCGTDIGPINLSVTPTSGAIALQAAHLTNSLVTRHDAAPAVLSAARWRRSAAGKAQG